MEGHLINLDTSVRQFKALFEGRLTAARAGKIDRLDTTISSRASATGQSTTHGKLNTNKAAIDGVRGIVESIADNMGGVPTGGKLGRYSRADGGNGYVLTVAGSGVLRILKLFEYKPFTSTSYASSLRLMVDGQWIGDRISSGSFEDNLAVGGIRFHQSLKIYAYSGKPCIFQYFYTLGD